MNSQPVCNFRFIREYSIPQLVRLFIREKDDINWEAAEERALRALYNATKHRTYQSVTSANRDQRSKITVFLELRKESN